jgi:AcrR family transcriptional regulator
MQDDTKMPKRARGRPRLYDPDEALDRALGAFWARGFSATSLDDLVAATGMNRPSLYAAFGDKRAIYGLALDRFVERMRAAAGETLFGEPDVARALLRFYEGALEVYFSADPAPGCFIMCTVPSEALSDSTLRRDLDEVMRHLDNALTTRFEQARAAGESVREPRAAAHLAQAVLHSLALRARAGASKAFLRKLAREAVDLLCGSNAARARA